VYSENNSAQAEENNSCSKIVCHGMSEATKVDIVKIILGCKHMLGRKYDKFFCSRLKGIIKQRFGVPIPDIEVSFEENKVTVVLFGESAFVMEEKQFVFGDVVITGESLKKETDPEEVRAALDALKDNVGKDLSNPTFENDEFGR